MPPAQAVEPGLGLPRAKREIRPLWESPSITCPTALRGNGGEGWHSRCHPSMKHPCPVPGAQRTGRQRWRHQGSPKDQALPWLMHWQGAGSIPCHSVGWRQGWGAHGPPNTWLLTGFLPGVVWIWPFLFGGMGGEEKSPG